MSLLYCIRAGGVSFYIDGPTKELLFQWPPNRQIGPRIKPYHVEGSLRELGYRPRGISFSGSRIWALDMDAVREKRAAQAKGGEHE